MINQFFKISIQTCLLLFCIYACSNETNKCSFGQPVALLSDTTNLVVKHSFDLNEQKSLEIAHFKNGVEMQFTQSGCKHIDREFQFKFPGKLSQHGADFWIQQAIDSFKFVGSISPEARSLYYLAQSIQTKSKEIKLGKEIVLEKGFAIKIDRINSAESSLLIVVVMQK